MEQYNLIELGEIAFSPTNTRGKGDNLNLTDLVASIKEKGVLMPILVRPNKKKDGFEVVAGHRRLAASKLAGLKSIPARILDLTDVEAREAQIVENLQREDVHPLDEGKAYRDLIEKSKPHYTIEDVAEKVGKSTKYVRSRLQLTNLIEKAAEKFKSGKLPIAHAALIAHLDEKQQAAALKECFSTYGGEDVVDLDDLRDWIRDLSFETYKKQQPWKDDKELAAAVGECVECPKGADLFGEKAPEECSDPRCYARKMSAFIELKKKEFADKKEPVTLVSTSYMSDSGKASNKGILRTSDYTEVTTKKKCEFEKTGLVVYGSDLGKVMRICTDKKCKVHRSQYSSSYEHTPEEKAKRKKEKEEWEAKEKAEQVKQAKLVAATLKNISIPLNNASINVLLGLMLERIGDYDLQEFVESKEWEIQKRKSTWGEMVPDYIGTCYREAMKENPEGVLKFVFEAGLFGMDAEEIKKISKRMN